MEQIKNLISLPEYCRRFEWPRKPQWLHWIYSKNSIAQSCVKKIGKRYLVDIKAFEDYIKNATLDESAK